MKDRDMHNVKVCFKLINNKYYHLMSIEQPEEKITKAYLANLAGTTIRREWCDKSMGGYITYVPMLEENQFNTLKANVERLGGTVLIVKKEG
jgi:hypothetical protein